MKGNVVDGAYVLWKEKKKKKNVVNPLLVTQPRFVLMAQEYTEPCLHMASLSSNLISTMYMTGYFLIRMCFAGH